MCTGGQDEEYRATRHIRYLAQQGMTWFLVSAPATGVLFQVGGDIVRLTAVHGPLVALPPLVLPWVASCKGGGCSCMKATACTGSAWTCWRYMLRSNACHADHEHKRNAPEGTAESACCACSCCTALTSLINTPVANCLLLYDGETRRPPV